MTVQTDAVSSGPYAPNGSTVTFPFAFAARSADEVEVILDGVILSAALFSVSLSADYNSGSVTFTAPPTGSALYIRSAPSFDQQTALGNQSAFLPKVIEAALDRTAIRDNWLKDRVDRAPILPDDTGSVEGLFPVVLPDGSFGWSQGTGADAALRSDLSTEVAGLLIGDDKDGNLLNRLRSLEPRQPVASYSSVIAGNDKAWGDALYGFWDNNRYTNPANRPRIRPVGGDAAHWGLTAGISEPTDHVGPLWMMQSWHNMAWARAREGDPYAKSIVALEWAHIKASVGLSVMGDATTFINSQDDASWKATYLYQVLDILGDDDALTALILCIPAITDRFKDTTVPQVDVVNLKYSPLGLQYDTTGDAGAGQSSTYEVGLMLAAIAVWDRARLPGFLQYAQAGSDWLDASFRQKKAGKAGLLTRGVVLDSSNYGGVARGTPINGRFAPEVGALVNGFADNPIPGGVPYLLGGNMAAAVLNARLWRHLGDAKYLSRALALVAAIAQPDTAGGMVATQNVTTPGVLIQGDPWSEAFWMYAFVNEVLTLPGADPDKACATAILATAKNILAVQDGSGFYGADWWGSLSNNATFGLLNGFKTFQARWNSNPTGGLEAGKTQIMTTANTMSVVQAGALLARWGADDVPVSGVIPSPSGPTLVDQILARLTAIEAYLNANPGLSNE